jgi:NAD+ kinase
MTTRNRKASPLLYRNKKVGIVYRSGTQRAIDLAQQLTQWLKGQGCKVFTAPEQVKIEGTEAISLKQLGAVDLLLVLGGDGTYLRAVRLLKGANVPILGFNLGSMGFLTSARPDDAIDLVSLALADRMEKFPRAMLEIELRRKRKLIRWQALNDLVLERGSRSKLVSFTMHSGPLFVGELNLILDRNVEYLLESNNCERWDSTFTCLYL